MIFAPSSRAIWKELMDECIVHVSCGKCSDAQAAALPPLGASCHSASTRHVPHWDLAWQAYWTRGLRPFHPPCLPRPSLCPCQFHRSIVRAHCSCFAFASRCLHAAARSPDLWSECTLPAIQLGVKLAQVAVTVPRYFPMKMIECSLCCVQRLAPVWCPSRLLPATYSRASCAGRRRESCRHVVCAVFPVFPTMQRACACWGTSHHVGISPHLRAEPAQRPPHTHYRVGAKAPTHSHSHHSPFARAACTHRFPRAPRGRTTVCF